MKNRLFLCTDRDGLPMSFCCQARGEEEGKLDSSQIVLLHISDFPQAMQNGSPRCVEPDCRASALHLLKPLQKTTSKRERWARFIPFSIGFHDCA